MAYDKLIKTDLVPVTKNLGSHERIPHAEYQFKHHCAVTTGCPVQICMWPYHLDMRALQIS